MPIWICILNDFIFGYSIRFPFHVETSFLFLINICGLELVLVMNCVWMESKFLKTVKGHEVIPERSSCKVHTLKTPLKYFQTSPLESFWLRP